MILLDFLTESSILGTVLPVILKLIGGARDPILHPITYLTLLRVGHGGQEITGRLTWWAVPAHLDEVISCLFAGAEKDLATFIQNDGFVENIVDSL